MDLASAVVAIAASAVASSIIDFMLNSGFQCKE